MDSAKALKISLFVVVLVALIYFIIDIFLYGDRQKDNNFQKPSTLTAISTEGTDKTEVPLNGIVITISGGKYHYMKADMSFKMKTRDDGKMLEKNIQDVRDLVLRYTSVQNGAKLETDKGKQKYKDGLKKLIQSTFGYDVEDIYFRNFVLAP